LVRTCAVGCACVYARGIGLALAGGGGYGAGAAANESAGSVEAFTGYGLVLLEIVLAGTVVF
jgi:hypothetical protein